MLIREACDLERYHERHADELGPKLGEHLTLKRGVFGPEGRLVRIGNFEGGVILEAHGCSTPIVGVTMAPIGGG